MARWTRRETRFFLLYSALITVLYEVVGLTWLQVPWTPIALVGTAVAFLIGFQNNSAYGRIWEARKIWGGIVNNCRTWTMMVRDMVSNEKATIPMSEAEIKAHKATLVHRQIAWMSALRYALRQKKPWETFTNAKVNKEWSEKFNLPETNVPIEEELSRLLSPEDVAYVMSKKNKANAILSLQSQHIRHLKENGYIWEFSFLDLEVILREFFTLQGKSERIKNFPYPRQYATITYDFVNLFVFLIPLGIVPEFSKLIKNIR